MKEKIEKNIQLISILICSKNRRAMLENLVNELKKSKTSYAYEIVVVEETDNGKAIPGTVYISHPENNRGIGYARNIACKHASGDILVFLDDDCKISNGWLDILLEPIKKDERILGVQGGVTVPAHSNFIGWAETLLGFPGGGYKRVLEAQGELRETRFVSTLNCAFSKCIIEKLGGFDEGLVSGSEDYLLAQSVSRLGPCLFSPKAIVTHEPRGSFRKIWNWFVTRGRADIELARTGKLRKFNFLFLLKSSIFVKISLLGIISLLITLSTPFWGCFFVLLSIPVYFLQQLKRYYFVWSQSKCSITVLIIIPVIKVLMDIAADCGRLQRLTLG